jgi:hypothetical protein
MIAPVTLGEFHDRIRHRCDMYDSNFVTDGYELTNIVNDSAGVVYDFLIEAFGDEFFFNSCITTVNAVSTAAATDLGTWIGTISTSDSYPISPWKIISVKFKFNNYYYPIKRIGKNQSITDIVNPRVWVPNGVYYIYHWEYIKFYPNPSSNQTILMDIIPALKNLYYETDTLTSATVSTPLNQHPIDKFSDLVVLNAAIKIMNKQERDITALAAEYAELKDHIRKNAPHLDRTPRCVTDAQKTKDVGIWDYRRYAI